jgi:serine/threonine-protein kinase RsbW
MAEERRLVISGLLDQVPQAVDFVTEAAESVGLDERGVYHCQMATDEWCTNIIEHAYKGGSVDDQIEIVLRLQPVQLTIIIKDNGPPFDPTTLPEPDPTRPLEDRQPGGLGWFFVRKVMDVVRYELKNGTNTLILIKKGVLPAEVPEPESPFPAATHADGVRVVAPAGRLDSAGARDFEAALLAQLDAGYTRLVVDMDAATYIASTGLKALLTTLRRLDEVGGAIALTGMNSRVREIFRMSGFDRLFTIAATLDDAAAAVIRATS